MGPSTGIMPSNDQEWLAERFEANRSHLRGVAYKMLGSVSEADDAVQVRAVGLEALGQPLLVVAGHDAGGWSHGLVTRVLAQM